VVPAKSHCKHHHSAIPTGPTQGRQLIKPTEIHKVFKPRKGELLRAFGVKQLLAERDLGRSNIDTAHVDFAPYAVACHQ
jgi:hypothetical protein